MMFAEMRDKMNQHIEEMTKDRSHLFSVLVDKEEQYNLYLDSFPKGTNNIFRKRREYDCSCCRGFIKQFGNVVSIVNGKVTTVWDFETGDEKFDIVMKKMSEYVKSKAVDDVFLSKFKKIGCHHNFEWMEDEGKEKQWDHFFFELPDRFVIRDGKSKGDVLGRFRSTRDVFMNSLNQISLDAIDTVLDLIDDGNLYRGEEYKANLLKFKSFKQEFDSVENKELYGWEKSVVAGETVSRIKNQAIGTLLVNITEGMDLDKAVRMYEQITAPANYKRPKAIFTQKMLDDAQKKIEELGFADSLNRRFATLDDITINDILFANKDSAKRISGSMDVFAELSKNAKPKKVNTDRAQEISVDEFVNTVLPNSEDVQLYFENKHSGNMVSLITSVNEESKSMFSWGNNKSWAYTGNVTDSMKERVKAFGGKIDGDLRCSLQWNEDNTDDCDLDLHCIEKYPNSKQRYEIYFGNKGRRSISGGMLDVDIIHPRTQIRGSDKTAVENIVYADKNKMHKGEYEFFVYQFSGAATKGFRAEIEFDGVIHSFDYRTPMRYSDKVVIGTVNVDDNHNFTLTPALPSSEASKTVWGVKTNEFVPVNTICFSPNFWSNNEIKTGHKHLFFMLKDCINNENPSGIFNEFLVRDLAEHRKVMEALSNKMRVNDTTDQLSGVGFALDKRNDVVVKVDNKLYKIKF